MSNFFFGDAHFSAMNPWNRDAVDTFIEWFKTEFCSSHKSDNVWFLGDLSDAAINPGFATERIHQLIKYAASVFKHVYVLTGNHELKLVRGLVQSSISFLNDIDNVTVIDKPSVINEGISVLCLPHLRLPAGQSLGDYYSEFDYSTLLSGKADICIGHLAIKDDFRYKDGLDISKVPAENFIFGHIHTRTQKEYIGSLWPCKEDEVRTKFPRCYIEVDENKNITEIPLPVFLTYKTVNYPEKIEPQNVTTVWTVNGLQNLTEAKSFYEGHYVKSVFKEPERKDEDGSSIETEWKVFASGKEALDSAIAEGQIKVSRPVYSQIVKTLGEHNA